MVRQGESLRPAFLKVHAAFCIDNASMPLQVSNFLPFTPITDNAVVLPD
jgi:hypothetical protein